MPGVYLFDYAGIAAELPVLEALLPFIDAMNIDLKGFTQRWYKEVLGGDLDEIIDALTAAEKKKKMSSLQ